MTQRTDHKVIFVYAHWRGLDSPVLMGVLSINITRGKEIFSFEYNDEWLQSGIAQDLDPDLGIMQKVLINMVAKDQIAGDSITISRSDLEDLLNSYLELQENYDNMEQNTVVNSYIQNKIRKNLEKGDSENESKLKL